MEGLTHDILRVIARMKHRHDLYIKNIEADSQTLIDLENRLKQKMEGTDGVFNKD